MDFRQITQPSVPRPAPVAPNSVEPEHKEDKEPLSKKKRGGSKWGRVFVGIIIIGCAILAGFGILALTRGSSEAHYVDSKKYQAVFLNNGQVYFGNIQNLNDQYIRLTNVYYLTQASDNSSNYTLVKLGCQQIHDPSDQMVVNRSQVTFWENLQDSGKVVASINQFKKQNPNGPDCSQVSNQTQADSNASTQGGSSTDTNTNTGTNTNNSTTGTNNAANNSSSNNTSKP